MVQLFNIDKMVLLCINMSTDSVNTTLQLIWFVFFLTSSTTSKICILQELHLFLWQLLYHSIYIHFLAYCQNLIGESSIYIQFKNHFLKQGVIFQLNMEIPRQSNYYCLLCNWMHESRVNLFSRPCVKTKVMGRRDNKAWMHLNT